MSHQLDASQKAAFQAALHEFESSMEYSADFAFARFNLGNLSAVLDQPQLAIQNYRAAIAIDNLFYPAKVNLAMLYNRQGKNREAEKLLREVVEWEPELYEVSYSLGLLLAEMQKYQDAERYLGKAAAGMNSSMSTFDVTNHHHQLIDGRSWKWSNSPRPRALGAPCFCSFFSCFHSHRYVGVTESV